MEHNLISEISGKTSKDSQRATSQAYKMANANETGKTRDSATSKYKIKIKNKDLDVSS